MLGEGTKIDYHGLTKSQIKEEFPFAQTGIITNS